MKRIFCNTKLKKIITSILLVIILVNYTMPSVVFADDDGFVVKTYKEWIEAEETKGEEDVIKGSTTKMLRNVLTSDYPDETKRDEYIEELLSKKPHLLKLSAKFTPASIWNWGADFEINGYAILSEEGDVLETIEKKYNELLSWTGKSAVNLDKEIIEVINNKIFPGDPTLEGGTDPYEVSKTIFELNKNSIIITVLGTKDDYKITSFKIPGKDEEALKQEAVDYMGLEANDGRETTAGGVTLNYENGSYTASGTIQGIMKSIQTMEDSKEKTSIATIRGKWASDDEKNLYETTIKEKILQYLKSKNYIEAGQDENLVVDQVYKYYKNDLAITVTVGGRYEPAPGTLEVQNVSINIDKNAVTNAVNAGSLEEVDDTATERDEYAQEADPEVDANGNKIEEEDSADAGGILLGLVVPLVNFVADAIVASVGSIMTGDGLSFGMDILVSKDARWKVPDDVTEFTDISTKSFVVGGMQYPNITYTPEEIFAGKIDLLSIDFISGKVAEKDEDGNLVKDEDGNIAYTENSNSDWNGIRATISQWYQVLRLIAIIGLLSVLIYTGIKIILSATAKDKAKYKEWIMNWFMAVAILFSMHFIMAFIISVTGEISKLITEVSQNIYVRPSDGETFATNLMGLVRFMVQSDNFYMKVGYEVMYIALIVYTIKFTFVYLKRVLNMAFLTLIAPIVALTYPIDKVNDGKAQGFDMWLKEYTFNALLQPMHCILYYVLVGSAVGVAASNPIYGIVVLAFMTEAEKLLKNIFGFSKAGAETVGGVGSAFAAGAIASNIAKMAKMPKGNAGKGGNGGSGNDDKALDNPKPTDKPGMDVFDDEPPTEPESPSGGPSAADAFQNSDDPVRDSRREELEEKLADGQISEDELSEEDKALLGIGTTSSEESSDSGEQENGNSGEQESSNGDSGQPVREMAAGREAQRQQREAERQENNESGRFAKGAGAVWRKIHKPIWDSDKSASYNWKRLGKGALKGTVKALGGFALGATAAAVQAGISITDGKYNPMEGIAAVTAGFAGAGGIVDKVGSGIGSVIDTYREGANAGDTGAQMNRAQERFADRDDVIAFNKKNYPGKEKEAVERQKNNYLTAGVTDLKDMKSGMKYANSIVGNTEGLTAEQIKAIRDKADRQAAATINFKKTLSEQGQLEAIRNKKKQQAYIDTMVAQASDADKARVRRRYENAFKSVVAYDAANA